MNKEIWQKKLSLARSAGEFLQSQVKTIKGIAVTGSVAYGDVEEDDDLDFFIISQEKRVWTTRLHCYAWAWLKGKKRLQTDEKDKWCLNLFLDESDLRVPEVKRSEFARLQVKRMRLIGEQDEVWKKFFQANADWLGGEERAIEMYESKQNKDLIKAKRVYYNTQNSRVTVQKMGDIWEEWCFWWQWQYMKSKITREYVSKSQIFFHPLRRESKDKLPEDK